MNYATIYKSYNQEQISHYVRRWPSVSFNDEHSGDSKLLCSYRFVILFSLAKILAKHCDEHSKALFHRAPETMLLFYLFFESLYNG